MYQVPGTSTRIYQVVRSIFSFTPQQAENTHRFCVVYTRTYSLCVLCGGQVLGKVHRTVVAHVPWMEDTSEV